LFFVQTSFLSQIFNPLVSTFTTGGGQQRGQNIECFVVFCVDGEECEMILEDENCPKDMPVDYYFGFSLFGEDIKK